MNETTKPRPPISREEAARRIGEAVDLFFREAHRLGLNNGAALAAATGILAQLVKDLDDARADRLIERTAHHVRVIHRGLPRDDWDEPVTPGDPAWEARLEMLLARAARKTRH